MSDLAQRQAMSLDEKIILTQRRIREWYEHWDGQVYVAFSGGKDSTVLKHLVETTPGVYDVPSVFSNTGLEYPEIVQFATSQPNVTVVRPKMTFKQVIEKYGYPVIGKKQARFIRDLQRGGPHNAATTNLRLTGMNRKGEYCPSMKLAQKWRPLVDAPFAISEQCCDVMKKQPMKQFAKESGRRAIVGTMAVESNRRAQVYKRQGSCNAFTALEPISTPMSFWTETDVLRYIQLNRLPYASAVYGEIVEMEGELTTTGESRTGCMFCMFGCHLEKTPNRFQRMAETHPRQYDYCMNELGLATVLDHIGVDYS